MDMYNPFALDPSIVGSRWIEKQDNSIHVGLLTSHARGQTRAAAGGGGMQSCARQPCRRRTRPPGGARWCWTHSCCSARAACGDRGWQRRRRGPSVQGPAVAQTRGTVMRGSVCGRGRRHAAHHKLLDGKLAVAEEDVQMMGLRLLDCASHFMIEFWILLDEFGFSGIGLDWIRRLITT